MNSAFMLRLTPLLLETYTILIIEERHEKINFFKIKPSIWLNQTIMTMVRGWKTTLKQDYVKIHETPDEDFWYICWKELVDT